MSNAMRAVAALLLVLSARMASAEDGTLSAGTGFDYSSGKYGEATSTTILYIPAFLKYATERWEVKVTVPYLRVTGPSNTVLVDGQPVESKAVTSRTTHAGMGDTVASAGYTAFESAASSVMIDVVGKLKLPTASAQDGLGTGKTDYALQVDLVKGLGTVSLLGTLGYRWLGQPADLPLRNVWFASVGVAKRFSPDWSAGVLYDYRQASTPLGAAQSEATLYAGKRLAADLKVQLYATRGFSEGSPDLGIGGSITRTF